MNTNTIEVTREDLTILAEELTLSGAARVVSAWLALCEPEIASYDLDDEEAPYELRSVIGTDIGWDAGYEGLDPECDIPHYVVYMRLHASYGSEWPRRALIAYLEQHKEMTHEDAEEAAHAIWQSALERYEEVRELHAAKVEALEAMTLEELAA